MRVGNFSVIIPEGRERDTGHVALNHSQQYTIRLMSHSHRRCDAEVTVDGKPVGTFRLNSHDSMTLERPSHDTGRFTFYQADSGEAAQVGVAGIASPDRGLIQVRFRVERQYERPKHLGSIRTCGMNPQSQPSYDGATCNRGGEREEKTSGGIFVGAQNCAAGVTGLSGQSQQSFYSVAPLDYDPSEETVITIRLVVGDNGPRPLTAASRANPVPQQV